MSTAGASILGFGYLFPFVYLTPGLPLRRARGRQPVGRQGPRVDRRSRRRPTHNFDECRSWTKSPTTTPSAKEAARVLDSPTRPRRIPQPLQHHFDEPRAAARAPRRSGCGCSSRRRSSSSAGCSGPTRLPHALPRGLLARQPPPQLEDRLLQHAGADRLEPDHGDGRLLRGDRQEPRRGLHPGDDPAGLGVPGRQVLRVRREDRPCLGDGPHAGCLLPGARFDAHALHATGAAAGRRRSSSRSTSR